MARAPAPPEADEAPPPPPASPPSMPTIADEQRARSDAIQKAGVDAWKGEHDERAPEDRAASTRQVPGVGPSQISEGMSPSPGSWEGSTRNTPEARKAQRKAAP